MVHEGAENVNGRGGHPRPNSTQLHNCADWHADRACEAWRDGDEDRYCHHIKICDDLRNQAQDAKATELGASLNTTEGR